VQRGLQFFAGSEVMALEYLLDPPVEGKRPVCLL
jgi:hypothetical protein